MSNEELREINRVIAEYLGWVKDGAFYESPCGIHVCNLGQFPFTDSLDALKEPIEKFCRENEVCFFLDFAQDSQIWTAYFGAIDDTEFRDSFPSIAAAKATAEAIRSVE